MLMAVKKFINYINKFYNDLKTIGKFDLKQSLKNNFGFFRIFQMYWNTIKKKIYIFLYIFITLACCPYLKNHYIFFLSTEIYSFYYIILFLFVLNVVLNKYMLIPTHTMIGFKNFFLSLKNFFLLLNLYLFKLKKFFLFFKNEVFFKNTLVLFFFKISPKFINYFTYWRPLFKRFSYFGFLKLTKNKFFKMK